MAEVQWTEDEQTSASDTKNKTFCVLNYNIECYFNKLDNVYFVQFVKKFVFVCSNETFLNFELNQNVF